MRSHGRGKRSELPVSDLSTADEIAQFSEFGVFVRLHVAVVTLVVVGEPADAGGGTSMTQSTKNPQYPILVGFTGEILGRGFVARVTVCCRAIAETELPGEWWVYGVTPGAVAGSGRDLQSAVLSFRERLKSVLADFMQEAAGFPQFKSEAEQFFYATDEEALSEWETARQSVRNGKLDLQDLPRDTKKAEPTISVVRLRIRPSENVIDGNRSCLAA